MGTDRHVRARCLPRRGPGRGFPVIGYGPPKGRRFDLTQVQAGLAVSADGGIPLRARVFGGSAAEVSQVVGAMKDLRAMAGTRAFLMIADSKPVSYSNVSALLQAGVEAEDSTSSPLRPALQDP
jgi:transposase